MEAEPARYARTAPTALSNNTPWLLLAFRPRWSARPPSCNTHLSVMAGRSSVVQSEHLRNVTKGVEEKGDTGQRSCREWLWEPKTSTRSKKCNLFFKKQGTFRRGARAGLNQGLLAQRCSAPPLHHPRPALHPGRAIRVHGGGHQLVCCVEHSMPLTFI